MMDHSDMPQAADRGGHSYLPHIVAGFLFLSVFLSSAIFRIRTFDGGSLDLQVMIKMGISLVTLMFSLAFYRLWAVGFLRADRVLAAALLVWMGLSCLWAPNVFYSGGAFISVFSVYMIMFLAWPILARRPVVVICAVSCTLISVLSILVYFINPEFGRMREWVQGVHVPGARLAGITGTANIIGYVSAFGLLLLIGAWAYMRERAGGFWFLSLTINASALYMSNSRSSMIALLLALGFAWAMRLSYARLAVCAGAIVGALLFLLFADVQSILSLMSRSGDVTEITSGTGRDQIWSAAWTLIQQSPIFGYGYGSSNFIIAAHTNPPAVHAHNIILQLTFSLGITGFLLFVLIMGMKIVAAFSTRDAFMLALIIFFLVQGITESSAFQGTANMAVVVFGFILAMGNGDAKNNPSH